MVHNPLSIFQGKGPCGNTSKTEGIGCPISGLYYFLSSPSLGWKGRKAGCIDVCIEQHEEKACVISADGMNSCAFPELPPQFREGIQLRIYGAYESMAKNSPT